MSNLRTLDDLPQSLGGKNIIVRADLNVPFVDGTISDTTRIESVLPTLRELLSRDSKVILLSHFGRPDGKPVESMSLSNVVPTLQDLLGESIEFCSATIGETAKSAIDKLPNGKLIVLENTRFHIEESQNELSFSSSLASLADYFVQDAFSVVHRAHSSTDGVARLLPSFAGRSLQSELESMERVWSSTERPLIAIVGGAKVSTKLALIENLLEQVDCLVVGGAMANTFLASAGVSIGNSLYEPDLLDTARVITKKAKDKNCEIVLPIDAVVAKELKPDIPTRQVMNAEVADDDLILDIGPKSIELITERVLSSRSLVWNGPLGAFETSPFDAGTVAVARSVAKATKSGNLCSLGGGGDTLSALTHAGVSLDFSFLSTGGGAFLEWLEGRKLPGLTILYD